jgi:hypothetical protein
VVRFLLHQNGADFRRWLWCHRWLCKQGLTMLPNQLTLITQTRPRGTSPHHRHDLGWRQARFLPVQYGAADVNSGGPLKLGTGQAAAYRLKAESPSQLLEAFY